MSHGGEEKRKQLKPDYAAGTSPADPVVQSGRFSNAKYEMNRGVTSNV